MKSRELLANMAVDTDVLSAGCPTVTSSLGPSNAQALLSHHASGAYERLGYCRFESRLSRTARHSGRPTVTEGAGVREPQAVSLQVWQPLSVIA